MSKNNNCESRKQFSKIDDITETKYGPVFFIVFVWCCDSSFIRQNIDFDDVRTKKNYVGEYEIEIGYENRLEN